MSLNLLILILALCICLVGLVQSKCQAFWAWAGLLTDIYLILGAGVRL